ncbi:MAG TPA: TonB-dependent receptor [Sphingobacteriaceae bacterium]
MFIVTLQAGATSVLAQDVTIRTENANLKDIFKELKKQTGYDFLYASADLEEASSVRLNFQQRPLKEVLDYVFRDQPVTYSIENQTVLIRKKTGQISLQKIIVTGRITDSLGLGLPGVSVRVKGTQTGTVSDAKGNYRIDVPESGSVLVFTFLGYTTQEHRVSGRNVLNVTLREEMITLGNVVVIGYGSVDKKDLTGSVSQVEMTDLMKAPVASFDQALAGRIAGVQVSSSDGQPGSGMDIVIRGANSLTQSNSPLYVIDGFPIEDPDNSALNPDDIASINVLKDASATAIYGSRGANGVIIIETKKGKTGKPVITFNSSVGFQQAQKKMEMMSPYDFVRHQLEVNKLTAQRMYTPAELDPQIDTLYDPNGRTLESYKNISGINWQDLLLRDSPMQIHSLAVRGGSADTKYSISGSLFNQEGIVLNTGSKRYQGRVSVDQTLSKKIRTGITANYSKNLTFGQQVNDGGGGNFTSYVLYRTWGYRPVSGNPDLDLVDLESDPDNTNPSDIRINPLTSSENEYNHNNSTSFLSNLYLEYDILKNLQFRSTGAVRSYKSDLNRFYNSKTPQGSPLNRSSNRGVNGSFRYAESSTWSNENTLTYKNTFKRNHRITLMGGFAVQDSKSETLGFAVQQLPNEDLMKYGLDEGIPYLSEASGGEYGLMSYFARTDYNFKSKYLFTATFRADGSSKFHPGNKWGYFPSAALAWNMKRESFLKNSQLISASKLRTSFGVTGNNRIGNYEYFSNLSLPLSASYSFNNATPSQGIIISELGNPNLKWESTEQLDIGYDLGLFNNRVEFVVDLYRKTTKDLLLNAEMPITTGYLRSYKNIGSIRNTGLELSLNTVNIKSKALTWQSSLNISFNENKILELTRNQEYMFSNMTVGQNVAPLYISRIGYPAGMFYGYIFDGIYQEEDFDSPAPGSYILKSNIPTNGNQRGFIQPGHIKYKDINDDGSIDGSDMTVIGRGQPLHTGGFLNDLSYKGFNLSVFLQWSYGNEIFNANRMIFEGNYINMFNVNQYATYNSRWTPENRSNELYKIGGQGPAGYMSTRVLEDGSYLRLKTVSLSYLIPPNLIKPLYLNRLSFNVSAQNLLTFTNYSGMDPETSVRHSVLTPGFDYSAYPQARTLTFGIRASF